MSIFKQKTRLLNRILCQTQDKPWRKEKIKPFKQLKHCDYRTSTTVRGFLFNRSVVSGVTVSCLVWTLLRRVAYVRNVHTRQQCERPHQLITRISDLEPLIMSSYRVLDLGPFPWPSQCRHSSRLTFYKLRRFLFFTRHLIKTRNYDYDKVVANSCCKQMFA